VTSLCPKGVISLQYVDDTLLFLGHDNMSSFHLKWLMLCYENLLGMRINYHKSNMTPIGLEEEEAQQYAKIFCCKIRAFPFRYLGVPLHFDKLRREDIQLVVDVIFKRIRDWSGRLLSYNARLILLKSCLASIPIYLMFVIKFLRWAIDDINSQMSNFFWNDTKEKHRYHLSNWQSLTRRKEQGGLGVPDLKMLNLCLLASWVQRYYEADSKLWKEVVDCKNSVNPNLLCCNSSNCSPFWKGVLWSAQSSKMGYKW
jgi:hypothetical protein